MDYKYIEQLLDRYWECHTTAEEEQILHSFFSQAELPAHLARFAPLFDYCRQEQKVGLSSDFDARFADLLNAEDSEREAHRTHARPLTLSRRLTPLFKAAAVVALLFMVGTATERAIVGSQADDETDSPILVDTYVRSSDVEAVIQPTEKATDVTAAAQNTDSLAHSIVPNDIEVGKE